MIEHIVAMFNTDAAADAAARDLEAAGIPASSIRRYRPHSGDGMAPVTPASGTESTSTGGGFWSWLLGEEPGTETAHSYYPRDEERYVRGARAGNAVVSVVLEDASKIHQVVTILEAYHPLEMEEETDDSAVNDSVAELPSMSAQFSSQSSAIPPASTPVATGQGASGQTDAERSFHWRRSRSKSTSGRLIAA